MSELGPGGILILAALFACVFGLVAFWLYEARPLSRWPLLLVCACLVFPAWAAAMVALLKLLLGLWR